MSFPHHHRAEAGDRHAPHLREVGAQARDVGDELTRARLSLGYDLEQVAEILRIRYDHLRAIEEGRFDDLPGPTYVVGFLRSYARYLGLDAEDLVERFKSEAADFTAQQKLHFPSPIDEGRLPTGRVLLVALVLAGAAYGGWYYVNNIDRLRGPRVPEVPAELDEQARMADQIAPGLAVAPAGETSAPSAAAPAPSAAVPPAAEASAPAPSSEASAKKASAPAAEAPRKAAASAPSSAAPPPAAHADAPPSAPSKAAAPKVAVTKAETPGASGTAVSKAEAPQTGTPRTGTSEVAASGTAPTVAAPTKVKTPKIETPKAETPKRAPSPAPVSTPAPAKLAAKAPAGAPSAPPKAASQAGSAAPAAPAAGAPAAGSETLAALSVPPPAEDVSGYVPRIFGRANTDARVRLRATQEAWVQITGAGNDLVLTRIFRPGDVYLVPNKPGLTLMTGNAGGLEVIVDGKTIAPLGPVGAVRRDVVLDPDKLLAGQH